MSSTNDGHAHNACLPVSMKFSLWQSYASNSAICIQKSKMLQRTPGDGTGLTKHRTIAAVSGAEGRGILCSVCKSNQSCCRLVVFHHHYHHHHLQSLNREGRLGTTDDFATSFLHFSDLHYNEVRMCVRARACVYTCMRAALVRPVALLEVVLSNGDIILW